jgi:hypothetical protein
VVAQRIALVKFEYASISNADNEAMYSFFYQFTFPLAPALPQSLRNMVQSGFECKYVQIERSINVTMVEVKL